MAFRHAGMKLRKLNAKTFTDKDRLSSRIAYSVKAGDARVRAAVDISKPYKPATPRVTDGTEGPTDKGQAPMTRPKYGAKQCTGSLRSHPSRAA